MSAGAAPARGQTNPQADKAGEALAKPACPFCGCEDVHRSHRSGLWDYVCQRLGKLPYRCDDCERRFHK